MTAIPLGIRTQTNIGAIERELSAIWRQAHDEQRPISKVCTLNLLVVCHAADQVERASEMVVHVSARHPHRAIVIDASPTGPAECQAWVQANCLLTIPGRPQMCSEQITLVGGIEAYPRIPATILSLLVPDVPVVLLWLWDDPFDDPLFSRLSALAHRVVLDAAGFRQPVDGLIRLSAHLHGEVQISGLSWGRLTPIRELIAQFFDAPATVPYLNELDRVTVQLIDRPVAHAEALLLIGWLASRLGWQLEGRRLRRADGSFMTIEIATALGIHEPVDTFGAGIVAIELASPQSRFSILPTDEAGCVVVRTAMTGFAPHQRTVRLVPLDLSNLVSEELRLLGRDRGFEGALRMAARLAR